MTKKEKSTVTEGQLVSFKMPRVKSVIVGRVYAVWEDNHIGVQDIWGTPYTVSLKNRSLQVL